MNYLEQLRAFGYPAPLDNARVKPYSMFDYFYVSGGATEFNLFANSSLALFLRNRALPISANEVIMIDSIRLRVEGLIDFTGAQDGDVFNRSFLQIFIDDREKIKIPLWEILTFNYNSDAITGTAQAYSTHQRARRLQFPLIINSSSNVQIKVVLSSVASSTLNLKSCFVELAGIKFDKLSDYSVDFRKGNAYERLSYTIYDTKQITFGANTTAELFSDRNKAVTDFSKIFPLGDKESFSIENIELVYPVKCTLGEQNGILNTLRKSNLKIYVDDIEYFNSMKQEMVSIVCGGFGAATPYSLGIHTLNGYTLTVPITIPANSKTKVTLDYPNTTASVGGTTYLACLLKGTLNRAVA